MPACFMAIRRPRLLITVATSVSSVSVPASRMASARIAMIWSPSTTSPAAVTARQRSASPSWARPRSAPCGQHRLADRLQVGGAAVVVDVEAVRVGVDRDDLGAGLLVRGRADLAGRAVGAVDDDLDALEPVRDGRRPGA